MKWIYQREVEETVDWFCRRAVPDAGDWSALPYGLEQVAKVDGRAWRVDVDVPTSAYELWLDFVIEESELRDIAVSEIHAVRSGRFGDEESTYVWVDEDSEWAIFEPED